MMTSAETAMTPRKPSLWSDLSPCKYKLKWNVFLLNWIELIMRFTLLEREGMVCLLYHASQNTVVSGRDWQKSGAVAWLIYFFQLPTGTVLWEAFWERKPLLDIFAEKHIEQIWVFLDEENVFWILFFRN